MPELRFLLDETDGNLLLEVPHAMPEELRRSIDASLGPGAELGCARPISPAELPPALPREAVGRVSAVRVAGYYHNSLVEGPGRRTSVLFAGCSLGCPGCWVPALHAVDVGRLVGVANLVEALLDSRHARDGVSILGGEPLQQPQGLLSLILELRRRACPHILCYSGYTYEALLVRARTCPEIATILDHLDLLIDGPFLREQERTAGPWTGSGNQRVIDVPATRRSGRVVLAAVV